MKLNEKEKKQLIDWGYSEEDILQIENLKYKFILIEDIKETKINLKNAKEKIGNTHFLSGIARAAFHRTAYRTLKNEKRYINRK